MYPCIALVRISKARQFTWKGRREMTPEEEKQKEAAKLTRQANEFLTLRKEEEFILTLKQTVNERLNIVQTRLEKVMNQLEKEKKLRSIP
jgi:hypothetical protein